MMSVLFYATEAIMDFVSDLIARIVFGEEELFEQKLPLTLKPKQGRWGHTVKRDRLYMVFDSPHLSFKPEIPLHVRMDTIVDTIRRDGKQEPVPTVDRIYLSSREVASDELFKQLKTMIDMLEGRMKGGGS